MTLIKYDAKLAIKGFRISNKNYYQVIDVLKEVPK